MEFIAGLVLWILANAVYVDMRRRSEKGIKRLVAFWIGWPGTLVGLLSVEEGSQPTVRRDDRDLGQLVRQIRRDRAVRHLPGTAESLGGMQSDDPGTPEERRDPDPPDPTHRKEN